MKKALIITMIATIITATAMLSGCGCDSNELTATADTATSASETHEAESSNVTEPTLSKEEQAIVDSGLKVDDKGNIVDENGKKLETKDGKAEIKTADGKTVTISTDEVKSAKLAQGDYYFVETKSPNGTAPYGRKVSFTISADSSKALAPVLTVKNDKIVMYETGGNGVANIYFIGFTMLAISIASAVIYLLKQRKHGRL